MGTTYVFINFLYYVVFNSEALKSVENGKYDSIILDDNFYATLKSFVEQMNKENCLDELIKDNLLRIIDHIRFTNKNFSQMNDLILMVNGGKDDNVKKFYLNQIAAITVLEKSDLTIEEKEIPRIMETITNRLFVISASHAMYGEESFEDLLPEFVSDDGYFDTIMYFCLFQEDLFENKEFLSRVKRVVELKKAQKNRYEKKKLKTFDKLLREYK